jgi:hypothetical protein
LRTTGALTPSAHYTPGTHTHAATIIFTGTCTDFFAQMREKPFIVARLFVFRKQSKTYRRSSQLAVRSGGMNLIAA